MKYTKTGRCIWCGGEEPDVTFYTKPHILPDSLGGQELGFDVCDNCNHYFGTAPKGKFGVPCVDHAFKEVFGAYRMFHKNLTPESYKSFSSAYFTYRHSEKLIKVKRSFNSKAITRQFKRGLYEVFLQKYHFLTGDGNSPKFQMVRDFARMDLGNPHVFYRFNNVILTPDEKYMDHPSLIMSERMLDDMIKYGYFDFELMGQGFYLEIFPTLANVYGQNYLQQNANKSLIRVRGNESIYEFDDITQIDFLMQRFNSK